MLEWLKRHAWKACVPQKGIASSNLALSAETPCRVFCEGFFVNRGLKNVPKNEKLNKKKVLAGRHLSEKGLFGVITNNSPPSLRNLSILGRGT